MRSTMAGPRYDRAAPQDTEAALNPIKGLAWSQRMVPQTVAMDGLPSYVAAFADLGLRDRRRPGPRGQRQDSAQDQPGGPPRMQQVQPSRLIVVVECRHQRTGGGLDRPVAERHRERTGMEPQ